MNTLLNNKRLTLKLLLVTVLALAALHLTYTHSQMSSSSGEDNGDFSHRYLTVGVDPEDLAEYDEMNFLIDSLLTREFDIQAGWIRNERVQLENLMYLRKIVQTPFHFPYTLANLDVQNLAQTHRWSLLSVSELLTRQKGQLNVTIDVGRRGVIYQRIDFLTNPRLRPVGKEIFFILNGLGSVFDDRVRKYLDLPETFSVHLPKEATQGSAIRIVAEENGKPVINNLPWTRNVFELDATDSERDLIYNFFETLNNMPNRGFLVLQDRPMTYELIRKQFPRAVKRGYIIRRYAPRW